MTETDQSTDSSKERMPDIPDKGPLFDLFNGMIDIAQQYALSSQEVFDLVGELHDLFDRRYRFLKEIDSHTLYEGGLSYDPELTENGENENTPPYSHEGNDAFRPFLDNQSIIIDFASEFGGVRGNLGNLLDYEVTTAISPEEDTEDH